MVSVFTHHQTNRLNVTDHTHVHSSDLFLYLKQTYSKIKSVNICFCGVNRSSAKVTPSITAQVLAGAGLNYSGDS